MKNSTKPTAIGDKITDKDGNLDTGICMSFFPPHWLSVNGIVIADYGSDEKGASARYDQLVAERRAARGNLPSQVAGVGALLI